MLDKKDVITTATIYNLMSFVVFSMWACLFLVSASLVHSNPRYRLTDHKYTSLLWLHQSYNKLHSFHPCPPAKLSQVAAQSLSSRNQDISLAPTPCGTPYPPPNLKIQCLFLLHWDPCILPECQLRRPSGSQALTTWHFQGQQEKL